MTWLLFIASTLACFRLTRLITDDKIFSGLRKDAVKMAPRKAKEKVKEGISCPFCVSFYVSVVIALWLLLSGALDNGNISNAIYQPAIWGGSVIWNEIFTYLYARSRQ